MLLRVLLLKHLDGFFLQKVYSTSKHGTVRTRPPPEGVFRALDALQVRFNFFGKTIRLSKQHPSEQVCERVDIVLDVCASVPKLVYDHL